MQCVYNQQLFIVLQSTVNNNFLQGLRFRQAFQMLGGLFSILTHSHKALFDVSDVEKSTTASRISNISITFRGDGQCSRLKPSYVFHFEGLSNFSLSIEVLVHHIEDFWNYTSET